MEDVILQFLDTSLECAWIVGGLLIVVHPLAIFDFDASCAPTSDAISLDFDLLERLFSISQTHYSIPVFMV